MLEIVSWLFDLGSGAAVDALLGALKRDPLVAALGTEVRQWVAEDKYAASEGAHAETLIADFFGSSTAEAPAREELRWHLKDKNAGEPDLWFSALWERWQEVRRTAGNDARPFFRITEAEAEVSLRKLAVRLHTTCLRTDVTITLRAILDRLTGLQSAIEQDRSERYALADARAAFLDFSQPLLRWPVTLTTGEHIERPEKAKILDGLNAPHSVQVVIGERGAGKSALLATIGHAAIENGWTLFAIKADRLNESSDEEMASALGLAVPLPQILNESSREVKTLLLIDQLDAVAEIADRSGRRLNFLLNLVQRVAGIDNLHILLSSRPFEYRTDARLTSIRADAVELQLPPWESIIPILQRVGHRPEMFLEPLQQLLRNPWSLEMYLRIASPDRQFGSVTELLEAVWVADVTSAANGTERAALVEQIANEMTESEELWVPSAVGDRYADAMNGLIAVEFLVRDGQRLAFRHQTFYEFVVARKFSRDHDAFLAHVRQRQDGLFVRPVVRATLTSMRDTASARYARTVDTLLTSNDIRLHIRAIVIDILAIQDEPRPYEVAHVVSRLADPLFGPRILSMATGSAEWFRQFRDEPSFRELLRDHNRAGYSLPLLTNAVRAYRDDVLRLVSECWITSPALDALAASVIEADDRYSGEALSLVLTVLRRSSHGWLISQAAAVNPNAAIQMVHADLQRQIPAESLSRARREREVAREVEQVIAQYAPDEMLEELATRSPRLFLDVLWPWFVEVCGALAIDMGPDSYRTIFAFDRDFDFLPEPTLVSAFVAAARQLAQEAAPEFASFVRSESNAEILTLHLIIAAGLEVLAPTDAGTAVDYLLGDSRRLALGRSDNGVDHSASVVAAAYAHAEGSRQAALVTAILDLDRYPLVGDAEGDAKRRAWNREHRLLLLDAIDAPTDDVAKIRDVLRREFPNAHTRRPQISGAVVGPRVTSNELHDRSDADWLRLFDEIPDGAERSRWDTSLEIERSGGIYQQVSAVREAIKAAPERADALLRDLRPDSHQRYAAAIIEALGPTKGVAELTTIVRDLDRRGFQSHEFRAVVAAVVGEAAKRDGGLDDASIEMLRTWLAEHPLSHPSFDAGALNETDVRAILVNVFSFGMSHDVPHRLQIAVAIADGLMARPIPACDEWLEVFRGEIPRDPTPTFWWWVLCHLAMPLNVRTGTANDALAQLLDTYPQFATEASFLRLFVQFMPRLDIDRLRPHIVRLRASQKRGERQMFGELIMLAYLWHEDVPWIREEIDDAIECRDLGRLAGIGFVAPYGWTLSRVRGVYRDVLELLASQAPDPAIAAVKAFLEDAIEEPVDSETEAIIRVGLANDDAVRELLEVLVRIGEHNAARKPQLAYDVATRTLAVLGPNVNDPGRAMEIAGALTSIALTLHRQPGTFRVAGLALFEQLIELHVREADAALELLDRRPTQSSRYRPARRRYRPRSRRSKRSATRER